MTTTTVCGYTNCKLMRQGAEARLYETDYLDMRVVLKERFAKSYRHVTLDDKLTSSRLLSEARISVKCRKAGVDTPCILQCDVKQRYICMEKINGNTVGEMLHSKMSSEDETIMLRSVGLAIAKIHDAGVIHGDLTTSNMMLRENHVDQICVIDFGLSTNSMLIEDRAVDMYVLERAFIASHPDAEQQVS